MGGDRRAAEFCERARRDADMQQRWPLGIAQVRERVLEAGELVGRDDPTVATSGGDRRTGWPPVESCTPLSSTMWTRPCGAAAPIVAIVPSFIRAAPSPSSTIVRRPDMRATPSPMPAAQPIEPTW